MSKTHFGYNVCSVIYVVDDFGDLTHIDSKAWFMLYRENQHVV